MLEMLNPLSWYGSFATVQRRNSLDQLQGFLVNPFFTDDEKVIIRAEISRREMAELLQREDLATVRS